VGARSSKRTPVRRRTIWRRRVVALAVPAALIAIVLVSVHGGRSADRAAQRVRSVHGSGHAGADARGGLQPGSDPSVLPGPVLIADSENNRLVEVSPDGRVLWRFPAPGDLAPSQTFLTPDDAFFSPDGRQVIVTQEDDYVISVIDLASHHIVYRYGHPGVPGSEPGYLDNPDDAMLMPSGDLVAADIKNCRVLVIHPPAQRPLRQLGVTGSCEHEPGVAYGSPNGAFPMANGDTAISEINGNWLDVMAPGGRFVLATHPPGFTYPSDTNEVRPGVFLSADYTSPGAIETFTSDGKLQWRYEPTGAEALNQPSLALPLPNGDILANDDKNDRVIVVDPRTDRVVWQYGATHVAAAREGFLNDPDGVDLAPPHSLATRFAGEMRAP
jgi:hypothetical protein